MLWKTWMLLVCLCLACSSTNTNDSDSDATGGQSNGEGGSSATGGADASGGDSSEGDCGPCSNGCCNGDTCIPFSGQSVDMCGAGEACMQCGGAGERCSETGSCTTSLDLESVWKVGIREVEAFTVSPSGDWDFGGSAPDLSVCLLIEGVNVECLPFECSDTYVCDFEDETFEATVTGRQIVFEDIGILVRDSDLVGYEDVGSFTFATTNYLPEFKYESEGTTGLKSVTFSIRIP